MALTVVDVLPVGARRRRARLIHAEDPDRLGYSLCRLRLSTTSRSYGTAEKCVVCLDLTRRTFVDR
jgi:hypothetical protein